MVACWRGAEPAVGDERLPRAEAADLQAPARAEGGGSGRLQGDERRASGTSAGMHLNSASVSMMQIPIYPIQREPILGWKRLIQIRYLDRLILAPTPFLPQRRVLHKRLDQPSPRYPPEPLRSASYFQWELVRTLHHYPFLFGEARPGIELP